MPSSVTKLVIGNHISVRVFKMLRAAMTREGSVVDDALLKLENDAVGTEIQTVDVVVQLMHDMKLVHVEFNELGRELSGIYRAEDGDSFSWFEGGVMTAPKYAADWEDTPVWGGSFKFGRVYVAVNLMTGLGPWREGERAKELKDLARRLGVPLEVGLHATVDSDRRVLVDGELIDPGPAFRKYKAVTDEEEIRRLLYRMRRTSSKGGVGTAVGNDGRTITWVERKKGSLAWWQGLLKRPGQKPLLLISRGQWVEGTFPTDDALNMLDVPSSW